jgi:hypothetical protein
LFNDGLVGGQGADPIPVEIRTELGEAVSVDAVDTAVAGSVVHDQPRALEDLEVLGDGGTTNRQIAREFTHSRGAVGKPLEDLAPGSITER